MKIYFRFPTYGDGGTLSHQEPSVIAGAERVISTSSEELKTLNLPTPTEEKAVRLSKSQANTLRRNAAGNHWL
jgi:hypothetical protein